jgi:cobalt-zinc-cadmium efflux system membrane fusion protein
MRTYLYMRGHRPAVAAAVLLAALIAVVHFSAKADDGGTRNAGLKAGAPRAPGDAVELSEAELGMIDIGAVSEQAFPLERQAVGSIDFNEDMAAQVFPPYQGRIVKLFAKIGDNVTRGQALLAIESPDLIQADSNLIAAAGVLDLTTHALERAKQLFEVQGMAEKDLQQAISDQQTAEGALKAARNAVAVFGKSEAEIDRMVKTRAIDPYLVVPSPISGRITARTAAPGDFVQPGNLPAPYAVADISRIWLNASGRHGIPRARFRGGDFNRRSDGRSAAAPRFDPCRDRGSQARASARDVRVVRHRVGFAAERRRRSAGRSRPGG